MPRPAYRFILPPNVFGTQTSGSNKPFQHPSFGFHHLYFFFLSVEASVIVVQASPGARTIKELMSMATSVRVECEYITELLWDR